MRSETSGGSTCLGHPRHVRDGHGEALDSGPDVGDDPPIGGTSRVTVVLADAHPLLRTGMRVVLERDPQIRVVAEAVSVASLALATRANSPSVAVVDIDLPGLRGAGQLRALPVPVLLVGEAEDPDRVLALLSSRVRGFVCKGCTAGELASATAAVAAGYANLPAVVASRLLDSYLMDGPAAPLDLEITLTRRERDVLRLMVEGNSTTEIARILVVQNSTVKSHIYHLLRKLGVNDRAQAVALAFRSGLLRSTISGHTVTGMDRGFSRTADAG